MAKKTRNYPLLTLEQAIELLLALHREVHFGFVPQNVLIEIWGLSPTSSTSLRKLAALSHFALAIDEGRGHDRKFALSPLGKAIVLHQEFEDEKYWEAIQEAAMSPQIYKEIWDHFGENLPSDRIIRHYLLSEVELKPRVADNLVAVFRETIEFARLGSRDVSSRQTTDLFSAQAAPSVANTTTTQAPRVPKQATGSPGGGIALTSTDPGVQVIHLPLFDGRFATMNVPKDLSETDYDHLVLLSAQMLKGMKSTLVTPDKNASTTENESAQEDAQPSS